MSRRARIWLAVAVVFILGNVGGGIFAAAQGEPMHAGLHAVLALVGIVVATALIRGRTRTAAWSGTNDAAAAPQDEITDRLSQLEHSVDAVAIEVERIGEGQRYMTRVLTQDKPPADVTSAGAAPQPARKVNEEA